MSNLFKLINLNLKTNFNVSKFNQSKKKMLSTATVLIFSVIWFFSVFFMAASGMLKTLSIVNAESIILIGAMAIISIYILIATIFIVNKTIFNSKDYVILLSFPIKKKTIINSKIISLFIQNLILSLLFALPVYASYVHHFQTTIGFNILYWISLLIIPIIPTIIGGVIGSILTYISTKFKKSNLIDIILKLLMIIFFFFVSYKAQTLTETRIADLTTMFTDKIITMYYPAQLYKNIIVDRNIASLIIMIIISSALYYIFQKICIKYFDKINSGLNTVKTQLKQKELKIRNKSPLISLYMKEIKRYFSSSLYFLNTSVGAILLLVSLIFLITGQNSTLDSLLGIPNLSNYFKIYGSLIFSIFALMSCTTNVSISLEGKSIYKLKSLPIKEEFIFLSKIMVNLTILLPTILIGSILMTKIISLSFLQFLKFLFLPIIASLLISVIGLILNLHFPNVNYDNEAKVIKQSASVFITLIITMLIVALPIILFNKMNFTLGVYMNIISIVYFIITAIAYLYLFKRGKKLFKKI